MKRKEKKSKREKIFDKSKRKGIIVTLPPLYVESPLKLIFQVLWLTRQIAFSIHRVRIVVGSITKSVDVFHENLFHFAFTLVFGSRRREGSGFLTPVASSTIFPSRKVGIRTIGGRRRSVDRRGGMISRGTTDGGLEV